MDVKCIIRLLQGIGRMKREYCKGRILQIKWYRLIDELRLVKNMYGKEQKSVWQKTIKIRISLIDFLFYFSSYLFPL